MQMDKQINGCASSSSTSHLLEEQQDRSSSLMCDSRKSPYPPPPHGWSMEIPRGGLKGRNFRGVLGVPTRKIVHGVVKDTIKLMYMWIILICSTTKIRSR